MEEKAFGNLEDWGQIIDRIEALKRSGRLDNVQAQLLHILRYKDNWRLRESVLMSIKQLENPCDEVLAETAKIMMDDNVYLDARILAASALGNLIQKSRKDEMKEKIIAQMKQLTDTIQPPILHEAIEKARGAIEADHTLYREETR